MTSTRLRVRNLLTRTLLKRVANSNYEPKRLRPRVEHGAPRPDAISIALTHSELEAWGDRSSPVKLLYVPGGGFCFGPNDEHRGFIEEVSDALNAERLLLKYRLAPEHPYPAAHDDTLEAIRKVSKDARKLVIMADSAGGTLALTALQRLRNSGEPMPTTCAIYLSAYTDLAHTGLSMVSNSGKDPMFGPEALIHKAHHYLQGHNPTDPRVSPFWCDAGNLPPSLFLVGSTEVLHDDSRRMVEKGLGSGCEFELREFENAPHTFPLFGGLPEAQRARREIVEFVRRQLNVPEAQSLSNP